MRAHAIKAGLNRVGAAALTYLTTRWWMPLVLYCVGVASVLVTITQILKWTGVIGQ